MTKESVKKMTKGAWLLSMSGLVSKILSAIYKIPLQNWAGDQGFYVYQQIYPFYALAAGLALNGIPLVLSAWIAEEQDPIRRGQVMKKSFRLLLFLFALLSIGLFICSDQIAHAMADPALSPAIHSVAMYYLLVPVLACVRGYFQGCMDMYPTALSQVLEQVVRVTFIIGLAYAFSQGWCDLYQLGYGAYLAAFVAGLLASVLLVCFWKKNKPSKPSRPSRRLVSYQEIARRLSTEGFLVSLYSGLLILLQLVDSFTVLRLLVAGPMSQSEAMIQKGIYDRAQPIAQLGLVVSSGIIYTMLPSLSHPRFKNNPRRFNREAQSLLKITLVFSGAATVGLVALMPQLNRFLFHDAHQNHVLALYMLSVLFLSLTLFFQNTLYLLNRHAILLKGLIGVLLVKLLANVLCVPSMDTLGASLSTTVSLCGLAVYLAHHLKDVFDFASIQKLLHQWLLALVLMGISVSSFLFVWDQLLGQARWLTFLAILLAVAIGASLYLYLVQKLGLLSVREWRYLPRKFVQKKD